MIFLIVVYLCQIHLPPPSIKTFRHERDKPHRPDHIQKIYKPSFALRRRAERIKTMSAISKIKATRRIQKKELGEEGERSEREKNDFSF